MKETNQKNAIRKMVKTNNGITLIALVVTIVVLLILAGISISMVLGNNGLITKAKDAKTKTEQDQVNTETAMNNLYDEMMGILGENGGSGNGDATSKVGTKFAETGTIDGGEASEQNPTIPEGYTPINTEDAKWDAEDGPEYNNGLVITDDSGNEWVWVPVADATVMYDTAETPIALTGGDANALSGVTVSKYTKSGIISGSSYSTRVLPNATSGYREVDVVVSDDGASYDAVESNRVTAGFTKTVDGETTTMTLAEMAQTMVDDYETMIASIAKYKGFYIGRYELTANGVKAGETLTGITWYQHYANCKNLSSSDDAITRMVWGCQWDVTCNWLADSGYSITDSTSWGNYSNYNTANSYEEGNEKYEEGAGSKQNTGSSENWKANNIYDFAGNCYEWSQEASDTYYRVIRGGYSSGTGYDVPASDRYYLDPRFTYIDFTSRPTLIVQP